MDLYSQFHPIPQSKVLTFYKKEPFSIEAVYTPGQKVPHPQQTLGTKFSQSTLANSVKLIPLCDNTALLTI